MSDDTSNVVSMPPPKGRVVLKPARAGIHDDDERFYLQIELHNDCALTLSYPKTADGDPPSVAVWSGNGEHDFGNDTLASFKAWAQFATGWLTDDEYFKLIVELCKLHRGDEP